MSQDRAITHITDLIPKNLDDIIRANRDKFRLAIATDEERQALERDLPNEAARKVRHTLRGWNILMLHVTTGGTSTSLPKLLGNVNETGQCWITSTVKGIDIRAGLVQTENSVYRVVGQRESEPDRHLLLHICAWLNQRGLGRYLGVPGFFY